MPSTMKERLPDLHENRRLPPLFLRVQALIEVVAVALLGSLCAGLLLHALGWNPEAALLGDRAALLLLFVSEAVFTMLLILAFLGLRGQSLAWLGGWEGGSWREVRVGLGIVPLLVSLVVVTSLLVQVIAPEWASKTNPLLDNIRTPADLLLFLLTGIFVGGVKEEIQRAFILRRFQEHLGGAAVGLIVWSIVFGAGHLSQGWDRALQATLLGLVFGLVYLWRGSLVAPIVSHALYDVLVVLLAYTHPGG